MPSVLLSAVLLLAAAAPQAPAAEGIRLSGRQLTAAGMVFPSMSAGHGWYEWMPERRELSPAYAALLDKTTDVQINCSVHEKSGSKAQQKKNADYCRGNRARAIKALRAGERSPRDERALAVLLWWEARAAGADPKDAVASLEQAAQRFKGKPGYTYLRLELAKLLAFLGRADQARAVLEATVPDLDNGGGASELQRWLGEIATGEGRHADAVKHYEASVAASGEYYTSDLWPRYGLAWAYLRAGMCDKLAASVEEWNEAIRRASGGWGQGDKYRSMSFEAEEIVEECRPLAPLFAQPGDDEERRRQLQYSAPKTAQEAVERALALCYGVALRTHPAEARPVVARASGELKAPRFEIVTADATPQPWPHAGEVSTCTARLLANAPFAGTLEGEAKLVPPEKQDR